MNISEKELLDYASQEELFLFASKDDYLAIANGVLELVNIKLNQEATALRAQVAELQALVARKDESCFICNGDCSSAPTPIIGCPKASDVKAPASVHIDVNKMVDRFLSWKLPSDFNPDSNINFYRQYEHESPNYPIGTNLFTAEQAKAMFEYCIHYQSDFNLEYTAIRIRRMLKALDIPDPSNGNDNTLMSCLFTLLGQVCRELESPPAPQSDYVLVPREPTNEMLEAVLNGTPYESDNKELMLGAYKTMITAYEQGKV